MATRKNISSGAPYEQKFGYSRAVEVGDQVFISGTTAVNAAGDIVGVGEVEQQLRHIFSTIEAALQQAGARFDHVVRTRIFSSDLAAHLPVLEKVHGEIFGDIRPASTGVEIARFVHPDMLVEIEVDAVIT